MGYKEKESFENKKLITLNKFFMKNVFMGLIFSLLLYILSVGMLVMTVVITEIDMAVKVTLISMVSTFILTTSKSLIDRSIEVVTYTVKLLGEEQRGLNKKIGVEVEDVEFNEEEDDG